MLLVSSISQNYIINSESVKILNLIILKVKLQVQFIKYKPYFDNCTSKLPCSSTRIRRRTHSNA